MKYHLAYKNFHRGVIRATAKLFDSHPWMGNDQERHQKFTSWIRRACECYGLPIPTLEVVNNVVMRRTGSTYITGTGTQRIVLSKYSVIGLFREFRHHMQWCGIAEDVSLSNEEEVEEDAKKWAASLFYKIRPIAFRNAVRDGKIKFMHPRELLANPDEYVEPEMPSEEGLPLTDDERRAFDEIISNFNQGEAPGSATAT